MLDDFVDVQNTMRIWAEDEPPEVITAMQSILNEDFKPVPAQLPMRKLLAVLDVATTTHDRVQIANTVFVETLEMTSDP
jgi:hypothetical protein